MPEFLFGIFIAGGHPRLRLVLIDHLLFYRRFPKKDQDAHPKQRPSLPLQTQEQDGSFAPFDG
jgi:hypothetical protein